MNSKELSNLFFSELKKYNGTNFKMLRDADLTKEDPAIYKCCSSVVTRYFIFAEKHPEISEADKNLLYYKLRIDLIAHYFSEYPASKLENLKPFQDELIEFVNTSKDETVAN